MSAATIDHQAPSLDRPRAHSLALSREAGIVLALTVLAAGLRFWRIGHQGFWYDEGNTAELVHLSPGSMLGLIPQSESTPPLYYCLAWLWARLFGYTEAPLRALSALVGVATVPVAYLTAAKLVSRRAGLIAAALTACSPILIWYSQEARSYELLVFLSGLTLLAFAYAREDPTPRRMILWVLAAVLALATHYYALLAVAPQAVWLLAVHRRVRPVQLGVLAAGLCGAGLIPLALTQTGTGRSNWIATIPFGRRLGQVIPQFALLFEGPAHGVLEPIAIAILILAVVLLITRSRLPERHGARVAGGLALAGLVLNLALAAAGVDDLITRNLFALWMPAAVFVAGGLAAERARVLGLLATAVLCGAGVATTVGVALDRNLQRPDWRPVAALLGHRATTPRVILTQHYLALLPLSLYMPGLKFLSHPERVSEIDVVGFAAPSGEFCWWGSACNLSPSLVQASYRIPGFRVLWRRHTLQFTVLRLVSERPRRLTAREVRRALRTTSYRSDKLLYQR